MRKMQDEDQKQALKWAAEHHAHVQDLLACGSLAFPPTGSDCLHPELWKPAHWRWLFLTRQRLLD